MCRDENSPQGRNGLANSNCNIREARRMVPAITLWTQHHCQGRGGSPETPVGMAALHDGFRTTSPNANVTAEGKVRKRGRRPSRAVCTLSEFDFKSNWYPIKQCGNLLVPFVFCRRVTGIRLSIRMDPCSWC